MTDIASVTDEAITRIVRVNRHLTSCLVVVSVILVVSLAMNFYGLHLYRNAADENRVVLDGLRSIIPKLPDELRRELCAIPSLQCIPVQPSQDV